jgi:hypothetical protein
LGLRRTPKSRSRELRIVSLVIKYDRSDGFPCHPFDEKQRDR